MRSAVLVLALALGVAAPAAGQPTAPTEPGAPATASEPAQVPATAPPPAVEAPESSAVPTTAPVTGSAPAAAAPGAAPVSAAAPATASAAAAEASTPAELTPRDRRAPAPDFALRALSGEKVRLSDLRGRVVLVTLWATWCSPCKQELAFLDGLVARRAAEGLSVLAINLDDPRSLPDVRRFVGSRGLRVPVLLDADGAVAQRLHPSRAMPFTLSVDRGGHRAHEQSGFTPDEAAKVEARVDALLREPAPP